MTHALTTMLADLTPLSLDALNAKAAMLERLDQKYIVSADHLATALPAFADGFDVLEIDGLRAFSYRTRYFDDPTAQAYHDHHHGRRKRAKIRVRHYEDAGLAFLEVKLKGLRNITVKKRLRLPDQPGVFDAACHAFVQQSWHDQYGTTFDLPIAEVLEMRYQRITLVARQGGERMTIDTRLSFWSGDDQIDVSPNLCILETKSARGYGVADAILRRMQMRPTKRVSKYCTGMAALGQVAQANRFLPALRRLGLWQRPGSLPT
jgi:hypothetical protein